MRLSISKLTPKLLLQKQNNFNAVAWQEDRVLHQGEQVLIHGPSGAGKTILLHLLYGLRKDYEGKIFWSIYNMAEINAIQRSQLRASSLSIVFQDDRLFDDLTVWENIDINRRLTNSVSAYDAEKWLDKLGLSHKMSMPVATLSPGEQQRVGIVRALAQPFEWLLLDAPFNRLDFYNKQKAIALINEVVAMTKAGIIITSLTDNDDFVYDKKIML